jgi:hypothetical protein
MEVQMLDFTNTTEDTWNFKVNELPLIPQGMTQPVDGWKVLVREDTGQHLHVHRNSYQMLPHDDVVNATYDSIKNANISTDFDFNVKCLESGRKLEIDILFNDLVATPSVDDHVKYRVRAYNSYDGSWAFQTVADAFRLWCLNGCTTRESISRLWMRHTSQISTEGAADKIIKGLETFHTQKDLWQEWMAQKVTKKGAENFFKATLIKNKTKSSEESWNKKQLEVLMGQLDNEFRDLGKNKWAVYNCMTHWATHTTANKNPHNVTRDRESKVAFALNHDRWYQLT